MNNKKLTQIIVAAIVAISFTACKKDPKPVQIPEETNETELITTFQISFIDSAGIAPNFTAVFRDTDGEGGNEPTSFDTIRLAQNSVYYTKILLLDESKTETDTISNEVLEEADEHLFCFEPSGINTTVKRTDSDGKYEIGLTSTWYTGNAANGKMLISLKHQPGIKNGSCDVGETDVELDFVTEIQ